MRSTPPTSPTGYRIDARRRFELQGAAWFTGIPTLQAVIDLAVTEFLNRISQDPAFVDALTAAERAVNRRAGVGM